jgi:hypothetical protein
MNKILISLVILVLVGGALYYAFMRQAPDGNTPPVPESNVAGSGDAEVAGPITAIDTSGVATDGPYLVTIMTVDNELVTIALPSMGILLCPAKNSITSVTDVSVGQTIEAKGSLNEQGQIVPCEKIDHYFRVAVDQKG